VEFRCVAFIAIWTLLIGPMFGSTPKGFTGTPRILIVTEAPAR
jgi:hypothetical protein